MPGEIIHAAAGPMKAGRRYEITYECDTPGPEVERGKLRGHWNGQVDAWGKLTFVGDRSTSHFFLREIVTLRHLEH